MALIIVYKQWYTRIWAVYTGCIGDSVKGDDSANNSEQELIFFSQNVHLFLVLHICYHYYYIYFFIIIILLCDAVHKNLYK